MRGEHRVEDDRRTGPRVRRRPVSWRRCHFLSPQLPIKVGHQNTHTKVSTEHNKECLINISKYKFSLVISGLTTILKNVNNMVSAAPPPL